MGSFLFSPATGGSSGPGEGVLSVVILCYDRREFVLSALASVAAQSLPRSRFELLVVKNFSDPVIDEELGRNHAIVVSMTETDHGAWVAEALERGRGDVFVFLDDDDRMDPDRLSVVQEEFRADSSLTYYHNGNRPIDADGRPGRTTSATVVEPTQVQRRHLGPDERAPRTVEALWDSGAAFNLSSIAVRRSILHASSPFLRRIRLASSAFLYFAALSTRGAIVVDPRPLTEYRIHGGNASGSGARYSESRWRREVLRAPKLAHDSAVILEMLRARGASDAMTARLRLEIHRAEVLVAVGTWPRPRWTLAGRLVRLVAASLPNHLGSSLPHLRLGALALLGAKRLVEPPGK